MNFGLALAIARTGYDRWAGKPHNCKWVRLIDGTPISSDLLVHIAMEIAAERPQGKINSPKEPTIPERDTNHWPKEYKNFKFP
jgi:hypothetical protein